MQTLQQALVRKPNVALIALDLPGLGGTEGLKTVREISPQTKVIAMSRQPDDREELDVLRTGARGYVPTNNGHQIAKVVDKVEEGEVWAARRTIGTLLDEIFAGVAPHESQVAGVDEALREKFHQLTKRERDILRLLGEGSSNKEIATALNVTVSTVKAHLTKVFRKLGQPDRLHLALAARPPAAR